MVSVERRQIRKLDVPGLRPSKSMQNIPFYSNSKLNSSLPPPVSKQNPCLAYKKNYGLLTLGFKDRLLKFKFTT